MVHNLSSCFLSLEVEHISREQNFSADLLSKLATSKVARFNRIVIHETLASPSIKGEETYSWELISESSWMSPILHYLQLGKLSSDEGEDRKIKRKSAKYTLLSRKLYIIGKVAPMLRCLGKDDITLVLVEVHKGVCNSHNDGKAFAHKLLRSGYYWSTLMKDNTAFVKKCDQCHRHADLHHALVKLLQMMTSPWPFYQWGVDILGSFPLAPCQLKFLIMRVDYSTKLIEAEAVAKIKEKRTQHFYGQMVICRCGLPGAIVSDNGSQFASTVVTDFCKEMGV